MRSSTDLTRVSNQLSYRSVPAKPDFAVAFNNRGLVRSAKGDLEGAIKDYNEAIRLKPDDAVVLNNRGNARLAKGDSRGAAEDFRKAQHLKAVAGA